MIIRILLLFIAFIVFINLIITTLCFITGENLYQKYGKQMIIAFSIFVFLVAIGYSIIALIGLN
ncbi:MAG: hypothetical protein E7Z90_03330 [Cyanobacteria bacterium SIG29]|nr:hypothetical protein [Cyanobacteria bacterium SIG29]